jgi:hypothetical protein
MEAEKGEKVEKSGREAGRAERQSREGEQRG